MRGKNRWLLVSVFLVLQTCVVGSIDGSGNIVRRDISPGSFSSVSMEVPGNLLLLQDGTERLEIRGDDNILEVLNLEAHDGVLRLEKKRSARHKNLKPSRELEFILHFKNLEQINIAGAVSAKAARLKGEHLDLNMAGSGTFRCDDLLQDELQIHIAGSGDCELTGLVNGQQISIAGSGDYQGGRLESRKAEVSIAGSGDVVLRTEDELNVSIMGSGSVTYFGSPQVTSNILGTGSVTQAAAGN